LTDTLKQPHHRSYNPKRTLLIDYIPLIFRYCMIFSLPALQALYDVMPCHYISLSSYSEDLRVLHPLYLQPVFILSTEHNHLIT